MSNVEWVACPAIETDELHATHSGVLEIMGKTLRCYRLSDGRAVIHADDMDELFKGLGAP